MENLMKNSEKTGTKNNPYDWIKVDDPFALAKARILFSKTNYGHSNLCNVITHLIDSIAKQNGFVLADFHDKAMEEIETEHAEQEAKRKDRIKKEQEEALARRVNAYKKKYGHEPFSRGETVRLPDGGDCVVVQACKEAMYVVQNEMGWQQTISGSLLKKI